jgi:hypothetical protein
MAIMAYPSPPPRTAAITRARIRKGKACRLSTTRITIHWSQNPLNYPLVRPTGTPTRIAIPTEIRDDSSEILAQKTPRENTRRQVNRCPSVPLLQEA